MTIKESRDRVIQHLGGKCKRCGFSDPRALQIDHVNGDGKFERRLTRIPKSRMAYHEHVINDTKGRYQLLCANCNWIKRIENGEHWMSPETRKRFQSLQRQGISYENAYKLINELDKIISARNIESKTRYAYFCKDGVLCRKPVDEMLPPATQKCAAPVDATADLSPRQKAKFHIWKKF